VKERHLTQIYSDYFQKFLTHTDKKKILLKEITKRILNNNASSLLDIGAGNGELAVPLSVLVINYVAIEQKPDYVKRLQDTSLKVINKSFPCEIIEKFDFILASHSLPWEEKEYKLFIESAINLLTDKGLFLGVTFDDERSSWAGLLINCDLKSDQRRNGRLMHMEDWLSRYYLLKKTLITTQVKTHSLDDIMASLAFVYSDGDAQKIEVFLNNNNVKEYIGQKNKDKYGYYFPFQHIFLEVNKLR